MKRHGPVKVIVYFPVNDEGKQELARHVSDVHADFVCRKINSLNCSTAQKLQLLDSVIETAKQRTKE